MILPLFYSFSSHTTRQHNQPNPPPTPTKQATSSSLPLLLLPPPPPSPLTVVIFWLIGILFRWKLENGPEIVARFEMTSFYVVDVTGTRIQAVLTKRDYVPASFHSVPREQLKYGRKKRLGYARFPNSSTVSGEKKVRASKENSSSRLGERRENDRRRTICLSFQESVPNGRNRNLLKINTVWEKAYELDFFYFNIF